MLGSDDVDAPAEDADLVGSLQPSKPKKKDANAGKGKEEAKESKKNAKKDAKEAKKAAKPSAGDSDDSEDNGDVVADYVMSEDDDMDDEEGMRGIEDIEDDDDVIEGGSGSDEDDSGALAVGLGGVRAMVERLVPQCFSQMHLMPWTWVVKWRAAALQPRWVRLRFSCVLTKRCAANCMAEVSACWPAAPSAATGFPGCRTQPQRHLTSPHGVFARPPAPTSGSGWHHRRCTPHTIPMLCAVVASYKTPARR